MANIKNYNQIVSVFNNIAERHLMVNTFGASQDWDIGASEEIVYPALWIKPINAFMNKGVTRNYGSFEVEFEVKVFDLVDNDLTNKQDVQSDTLKILRDVATEFSLNPYYMRSDFSLINDLTFDPFTEKMDDDVTGWTVRFRLRTPNTDTFCGIPMTEIEDFSFESECAPCIDVGVTDKYTINATLVSGATITFDRNDLEDAYSVDLSGLVTTGTTGDTRIIPLIYEPNGGNANIIPALGYNGIAVLSNYSSILGGKFNGTSGPSNYSTVLSGKYNLLGSSDYSVLGGLSNVLSNSDFCTVFGGKDNAATSSNYSTLGGGKSNEMNTAGYSVIGGGYENKITNTNQYGLGFIGNGWQNDIIGGGYSTILNGYDNNITGTHNTYSNTIGSGFLNTIFNDGSNLSIYEQDGWNTIGNGQSNSITGSVQSIIVGGLANTIKDSKYSTVVNGSTNNIDKTNRSIIGGGYSNTITSLSIGVDNYSGIFCGSSHDIESSGWSVINGGYNNNITDSNYSVIGGGKNNEINVETGASNVICGGGFSSANNSIIATNGNQAFMNFIGGGNQNDINAQSGVVNYSSIVGGSLNIISASNQAFIGGGYRNNIGTNSVRGVVVGGDDNNVYTSAYGFIGSGKNNDLSTAKAAVVVGGINNNIFTSTYSGILGGKSNDINTNSNYSTIGGGLDNDITSTSTFGFIGGGKNHDITTSTYSSVLGGLNNDLNGANHSNIIGSNNSITTANYSSVIGGYGSTITNSSWASIFNAGGASITNSNSAAIISDKRWGTNFGGIFTGITNSNYGVIIGGVTLIEGKINYGGNTSIGGYYNHIKDSDYCTQLGGSYAYFNNSRYSTIIGGESHDGDPKPNKIIDSSNSNIIGSLSNQISGLTGTTIIGSNITATTSNTTYVNKLNIYDTPSSATTDNVLSRESNGEITLKDLSPRYYKAYGTGYTYGTGNDISILLDWADESLNSGHFTAITGVTTGGTSGSLGNIFIQVDEDGIYDIDTFISYQGFGNSVRDRLDAMVRINDVRLQERSYGYNRDYTVGGDEVDVDTVSISTLVELTAGDTIAVESYKQTTNVLTLLEQWLTIKKL